RCSWKMTSLSSRSLTKMEQCTITRFRCSQMTLHLAQFALVLIFDWKNKLGPELNGLDGRKAGTVEGYADADKNSGIVWSEASFKEYLKNPQERMPGTKMILSVNNEKELADLWAYHKQFEGDGKKKSQ